VALVPLAFVAATLFAPLISVVALAAWARRLQKHGAPRLATAIAFALIAISGFVTIGGCAGAAIHLTGGGGDEPSQKARALAEGISEAMNCGALALVIASVAAAWMAFWAWRRRRR
jgi:hypothetical protein